MARALRTVKLRIKRGLACALELGRVNDALRAALRAADPRYVRAVYYHDVPARLAEDFDRQLDFFERHFEPVGPEELRRHREGSWRPRRPGLLLTFDDGVRSHAEVVAPLLDRRGWRGWFFVPSAFIDCPPADQARFAREHRISCGEGEEPRIAMTWQQVRELAERHVIGAHTVNHVRLCPTLDQAVVRAEVIGSKRAIEARLGREIESFAWVGGEEGTYSAAGQRVVREAGFRDVFTTLSAPLRAGSSSPEIHRTHLDPTFPLSLIKLQLSGLVDLEYVPRRRRIHRAIGLAPARGGA